MTPLDRETKLILRTIEEIVANGTQEFRPGHVADALRETSTPMLTYQIRGEFSKLRDRGILTVDPATGDYQLVEAEAKAQLTA